MWQVIHIVFGAAFTVGVSVALGSMLLRRLGVRLYRQEAPLVAFVAGSGCLSLGVFVLCLVHLASAGVFLVAGSAAVLWAVWSGRGRKADTLPHGIMVWNKLFLLVFDAFFIVYFFNGLAPEVSPDGSGYHLGNVRRLAEHHGFDFGYRSMYSYLPQGLEMLFLVAFSFGGHSAAALVHLAFLLTLPLLIVCYGRRCGMLRAGMFAGLVVYVSPIVGLVGAFAYNDVAVATVIFAAFYVSQVKHDENRWSHLFINGLLIGFACAIKYTAGLALPLVWWWSGRRTAPAESRRQPERAAPQAAPRLLETEGRSLREPLRRQEPASVPRSRDAAGTSACATWFQQLELRFLKKRAGEALAFLAGVSLMTGPWALRNWIWAGNPAAPFFNRLFPNPYYHPGMEHSYLSDLRHLEGIGHVWEIPLELALFGGKISGIIGPVFLLAPFALLALRHPLGRKLLLAAVVMAVPAWFNTEARFLIPSLPFLSLAMGIGLANSWGVLPALALFQAVACWPGVLSVYAAPWSWHIRSIPVQAALRRVPEAQFLRERLPDYALKELIERAVAPGQRIFTFAGRPEAYFERDLVVGYESALGNLAQDILYTPLFYPPVSRQQWRFEAVTALGARAVETDSSANYWTVSEMRILLRGGEVPRSAAWRMDARPNPWEASLAFDGSFVTRWSAWQAMTPRSRREVDFGGLQRIDQVVLESVPTPEAHVEVEIRGEDGRWTRVRAQVETTVMEGSPELRRAAAQQLKTRGIFYLLINDSDYVAADMKKNASFWGITELAEANGTRFYRID